MPHSLRLFLRCSATLTVILAAAVGCGSDSSGVGGVDLAGKPFANLRGDSAVTIEAADNDFRPQYVTVRAGTKVTFDNVGRNLHNVWAVDDRFASIATSDFDPGQQASVAFDRTGDYPYYCTLHGSSTKGMIGAIRVVK